MKKIRFVLPLLLIISIIVPNYAQALIFNPALNIYSEGVYMLNLNEDQVVYQKNQNELFHPASLTKIMTAVVVLEHFADNPEDMKTIKISAPSSAYNDFAGKNVSTADIRANEKVSYYDLLYALMLPSACEAGNIIAYNLGGKNIENFVKKMNETAKRLGMTNTNFVNAHGLHDDAQVSSPRDMAILAKYALTFPTFVEVSSAKDYRLPATDIHPNGTYIRHTNAMLHSSSSYYYEHASGIKTGTLDEAGRCLISTASKGGIDYLTVSMSAPMRDEKNNNKFYNCIDHKTLYEWAYGKLSFEEILSDKTEIDNIKVEFGKNKQYVNVIPADKFESLWSSDSAKESIKQIIHIDDNIIAPIKEGQILGKLDLEFNGDIIFSTELVAVENVEREVLGYKLTVAKQFFSSKMMKRALLICLGIIILYTIIFILRRRKPRARKSRIKPSKKRY